MPIPVQCPGCKNRLTAPESAVGRNVRCTRCGTVLTVPAPGAAGADEPDTPPLAGPSPRRPGGVKRDVELDDGDRPRRGRPREKSGASGGLLVAGVVFVLLMVGGVGIAAFLYAREQSRERVARDHEFAAMQAEQWRGDRWAGPGGGPVPFENDWVQFAPQCGGFRAYFPKVPHGEDRPFPSTPPSSPEERVFQANGTNGDVYRVAVIRFPQLTSTVDKEEYVTTHLEKHVLGQDARRVARTDTRLQRASAVGLVYEMGGPAGPHDQPDNKVKVWVRFTPHLNPVVVASVYAFRPELLGDIDGEFFDRIEANSVYGVAGGPGFGPRSAEPIRATAYMSTDGGYRVVFPRAGLEPRTDLEQVLQVRGLTGDFRVSGGGGLGQGRPGYTAGYVAFPLGVTAAARKQHRDAVVRAITEEDRGGSVTRSTVTVNGRVWDESRVFAPVHGKVVRVFQTDSKLYVLAVEWDNQQPAGAEQRQFFESFALTE